MPSSYTFDPMTGRYSWGTQDPTMSWYNSLPGGVAPPQLTDPTRRADWEANLRGTTKDPWAPQSDPMSLGIQYDPSMAGMKIDAYTGEVLAADDPTLSQRRVYDALSTFGVPQQQQNTINQTVGDPNSRYNSEINQIAGEFGYNAGNQDFYGSYQNGGMDSVMQMLQAGGLQGADASIFNMQYDDQGRNLFEYMFQDPAAMDAQRYQDQTAQAQQYWQDGLFDPQGQRYMAEQLGGTLAGNSQPSYPGSDGGGSYTGSPFPGGIEQYTGDPIIDYAPPPTGGPYTGDPVTDYAPYQPPSAVGGNNPGVTTQGTGGFDWQSLINQGGFSQPNIPGYTPLQEGPQAPSYQSGPFQDQSAVGLLDLGSYIERQLAQPNAFDAQTVQGIRDNLQTERDQQYGYMADNVNADAARRGTWFGTAPAFEHSKLAGDYAQEEALADAQLLTEAARSTERGMERGMQSGLRFNEMAQQANQFGQQMGFNYDQLGSVYDQMNQQRDLFNADNAYRYDALQGNLGLGYNQLNNQTALGLGDLDLRRYMADSSNQQFNSQQQYNYDALNSGLGLSYDQLNSANQLGLGQLDLGRYQAESANQLGLGQLGLGQDRLSLDALLGQGNLANQTTALGMQGAPDINTLITALMGMGGGGGQGGIDIGTLIGLFGGG